MRALIVAALMISPIIIPAAHGQEMGETLVSLNGGGATNTGYTFEFHVDFVVNKWPQRWRHIRLSALEYSDGGEPWGGYSYPAQRFSRKPPRRYTAVGYGMVGLRASKRWYYAGLIGGPTIVIVKREVGG